MLINKIYVDEYIHWYIFTLHKNDQLEVLIIKEAEVKHWEQENIEILNSLSV